MHTNGTAKSEPFAKIADLADAFHMAPPPLVGKPPKTWPTALEMCRKARGWSHSQLIAQGLKGENVSVSDVKRWELGRDLPTLNQCNKLRAALPTLWNYEDMLRLDRRAEPRAKKTPLPAPVQPEGWMGPPVKTFGEALRYCRVIEGMTQGDLAKQAGLSGSNISQHENGNVNVVQGTYEVLLSIFPQLEFAPKPKFSSFYKNRIRKGAFLTSERLRQEQAALQRTVEAPKGTPTAPPARDTSALNMAGAALGVATAELYSLRAKEVAMKERHERELQGLLDDMQKAQQDIDQAQARLNEEAQIHGGAR